MNHADIILNQIKTIDPFAMMAWGVKNLVRTKSGLMFSVGGLAKFKGLVHIKYNNNDLYDIDFFRLRKGLPEIVKTSHSVFVENLVDTIDVVVS